MKEKRFAAQRNKIHVATVHVVSCHFTNAKDDCSRDKKDRSTYEGLLKKITTVEFVLDVGLMCDALQELSELSLEL
jgi:hypothetical protein